MPTRQQLISTGPRESTMRDRTRGRAFSRRELMAYSGTAALAAAAGFKTTPALAKSRFAFATETDYNPFYPHAAFDVGRVAVRLNLYDGLMRWENNPAVL